MRHSSAEGLSRSAPRTVVALTLVGAALCGMPPSHAAGAARTVPSGFVMHAPVRSQSPTPNRNLTKMPSTADVLAGDLDLGGNSGDYIRVISPKGALVSGPLTARESGDDTLLTTPVSGAAKGWYLVHWNVVSGDGHPMGGDDGAWWSFGFKATTVAVKKPLAVKLAPVVTGTSPLTGTINGARTGLRTITLSKMPGTVHAARWTLQGSVDGVTNPQFSWDVSSNRKMKTAKLSGIVPRIGTYNVSVLVTVPTATGTSLNEYMMTVRVTA